MENIQWVEKVITVLVSIFIAWGVMRERVLKLELKNEQMQKDIDMNKKEIQKRIEEMRSDYEDLETRIWERFDNIEKMLMDIKLKLERNNVR
jgi:peptidoglycan hydrolase CwlO-like protein